MAYSTGTRSEALTGSGTSYHKFDASAQSHTITIDDMTAVTSVALTNSDGDPSASSQWKLETLTDYTDASDVAMFVVQGGVTGLRVIRTGAVTIETTSRFD